MSLSQFDQVFPSFRWVALQLKQLLQCADLRTLKNQLRALPKNLEATYWRMLRRASNADDLKAFLHWVALAARPITVEELAEVTSIDLESGTRPCYDPDLKYIDPRDALAVCSGFLTVFEGKIEVQSLQFDLTGMKSRNRQVGTHDRQGLPSLQRNLDRAGSAFQHQQQSGTFLHYTDVSGLPDTLRHSDITQR